jgi:hypothetical protein
MNLPHSVADLCDIAFDDNELLADEDVEVKILVLPVSDRESQHAHALPRRLSSVLSACGL